MRFFMFTLAMLCTALQVNAQANKYIAGIHKTDTFTSYAVVSAHTLASRAGAAMLARGGNAFDAAVATQLALAVVYPNAGNLGGGGFLLGRKPQGQLVCIDYRETAPSRATRDMYLDAAGNAVAEKSMNGHLAAGVPGTPAGLQMTLKHARLPWATLIAPAIELAEQGFAITAREARAFNELQPELQRYNTQPTALFRPEKWKAGDVLKQPELGRTLRRMQQYGPREFYTGRTAELIVAEMQRGGGIISRGDLATYKAVERNPLTFGYKNYEVIGFPPPSSGGLLTAQMLGMLSLFPLPDTAFQSVQNVHLMVEIERRAYADRAVHMADPDFYPVPAAMLTKTSYLQKRMEDFRLDSASYSRSLGAGHLAKVSEETTHISIYDAEGNMVSVTTTLNNSYGSKTFVGGAGFLLNDEMDDFSAKPGSPNMYGAIGGEANAIAPGKRMLSSMTPTLVLSQGKPFLIVGTPGGTTIPTSVFQSLVNVIHHGMSSYEAVNAPKFHHQWMPDEVFVEPGFPQQLRLQLQQKGHKITQRGPIGRTEMIRILPNGHIEAAADNRGEDAVAGK